MSVLLSLVLLSMSSARADTGSHVEQRSLNGHPFLSGENLGDPFVNGFVSSGTGLGLSKSQIRTKGCAEGNVYCLDDVSFSNGLVAQHFQLQIQGWNRVAVHAGVHGDISFATDEDAALYQAAEGDVGGFGEIKLKAYGNEWMQAAVSVGVDVGGSISTSAAPLLNTVSVLTSQLQGSQDNSATSDEDVAEQDLDSMDHDLAVVDQVLVLETGAHAGWGLHRSVGLLTSMYYAHETDASNGHAYSNHFLTAELAVSTNLKQVWSHVPIGALVGAEHRFHLAPSTSTVKSTSLLGGIYGIPRDYLELGLELRHTRTQVGVDSVIGHQLQGSLQGSSRDEVEVLIRRQATHVTTRLRVFF